jgi:hypothetical protein
VKSFGVFQSFELSEKAELLLTQKALPPSHELTAKKAAKYLHGEEEMVLGMDPARVVWGKASGRYDARHVGMSLPVLSPGMEHAPKADLGAERLRIGGNLRQGLSAGLKQQVIDGSVVLQRQRGQFLRQGEDHVKIADAEQFVRARGEPAVAGVGLALGAVPVATGEKGDGTMTASGALIEMAAQRCRAAVLDGPEHLELLPAQMGLVSPDEAVARGTDDVGHLQGGPLPLFLLSLDRLVSWALWVTVS